jgi:hypothetical protein
MSGGSLALRHEACGHDETKGEPAALRAKIGRVIPVTGVGCCSFSGRCARRSGWQSVVGEFVPATVFTLGYDPPEPVFEKAPVGSDQAQPPGGLDEINLVPTPLDPTCSGTRGTSPRSTVGAGTRHLILF